MKPQSFARMPEIKVAGIRLQINHQDGNVARITYGLWQKFYEEKVFEKIPHKFEPHCIIALFTDYDKERNGTLILGTRVLQYDLQTMPNGMVFKTLPAAHYALFSGQGPTQQIVPELWKAIGEDKKLQRTYRHDFELYPAPIDKNDAKVEIYVGVHGKL